MSTTFVATKQLKKSFDEDAGAYTHYEYGEEIPEAKDWSWQTVANYERAGYIRRVASEPKRKSA